MIVFNSDDLTIALKVGDKIVCVHAAKKERIKRVHMLMDQYAKVRPGTVTYVELKNGETKIDLNGDEFTFIYDEYGARIRGEKTELYIRTNYSGNYFELDNAVDMAYLAENKDRYNLVNGAKVIPW